MQTVRLRAHAKINLALSLAGPEPAGAPRAGWHRISTWMHAIELADDVLIEPLAESSDAVSTWSARWAPDAIRPGVIDWPPERDLAWRALRAVEAHVGRPLPTRLVLTKRIPTGAGLGGGSADAGTTLLAVNQAWGLGLGVDVLQTLGATLGSDVPFFVDTPGTGSDAPGPAVVGGFGEAIERTPRAAAELVLMVPAFGCATGSVYRAFDESVKSGHSGTLEAERIEALARRGTVDSAALWNDLAEPACAVQPELTSLRMRAREVLGEEVHITGSGSAMFAIVESGAAAPLAERLRAQVPGLAALATRLI